MTAAGYLLCASPRSGSTLTCDLLAATGVAGAPNSFFRAASMADFCAEWNAPQTTITTFDLDYLATAHRHGTAGTGCFGMRSMWGNMADMLDRLHQLFPDAATDVDVLTRAFGPLHFIHLTRRDKLAGAVSLAMAAKTGLWHRNADGTERERLAPAGAPVYDAALIARELAELVNEAKEWDRWFDAQNITPLRLTYEDVAADPQAELARMLSFLGKDPALARFVKPATQRLATTLNEDWAARFRKERG